MAFCSAASAAFLSVMSRKVTTAPMRPSSGWQIGVLTYSTGKLVPSFRQNTSSSTRWTTPSLKAA